MLINIFKGSFLDMVSPLCHGIHIFYFETNLPDALRSFTVFVSTKWFCFDICHSTTIMLVAKKKILYFDGFKLFNINTNPKHKLIWFYVACVVFMWHQITTSFPSIWVLGMSLVTRENVVIFIIYKFVCSMIQCSFK